MTDKKQKRLFQTFVAINILGSFLFAFLTLSPSTEAEISTFIEKEPILSRVSFVFLNFISIVILPFSMAIMNLIAVKYMTWYEVVFYSILGNISGYIYAYLLGKYFSNFTKKLFRSASKIDEFKDSLNPNEKFGSLILFRIAFQNFSDYTSYFLGLIKINFKLFLFTALVSELVIKTPKFYLVYLGLNISPYYFSGIFLIIFVGWLVYKTKFPNRQRSNSN